MAAQVIAASLGLDLFRIDLSSVVSKYVGETSQNLERILSRAAYMDIVLFFDEADALFGKRTEIKDAHDRFANTDTDYLLQAIENYTGIVLLGTNKKANMDPAFLRRLRYVLEFPPPDESQRLRIWQQVLAELAGAKTASGLAPKLQLLAREVTTTGAQIKFSILAALFIARREGKPVSSQHLVRGLKRELLKEGRSLSDRDMEKLMP
jgi:SpoVK/Ycf46/Vps4 family AAA+-type ATPase